MIINEKVTFPAWNAFIKLFTIRPAVSLQLSRFCWLLIDEGLSPLLRKYVERQSKDTDNAKLNITIQVYIGMYLIFQSR